MPAAITHQIFAEKVLSVLENTQKIEVNKKAFFYGAQGPDIFFTHRYLPWQKGESIAEVGTKIHNSEPNKVLSIMRSIVAKNNNVNLASYFLGFICHYSLDSVCHPYIDFIANEQLEEEPEQTHSIFHCESEAALEAIVYRSVCEDLASKVATKDYFVVSEDFKNAISDFYIELIKELLDIAVSKYQMLQMVDDAVSVHGWMDDKIGFKKFIINAFEGAGKRKLSCHLIPDLESDQFDYANISKSTWKDLEQNDRNETFFELIEMAIKKATNIIGRISAAKDNEICDNAHF